MEIASPSTILRFGVIPLVFILALMGGWFAYRRHPLGDQALLVLRVGAVAILLGLIFFPALKRRIELMSRPEIRIALDVSASMTLDDALGRSRIERARALVRRLVEAYSDRFNVSLWGFGAGVRAITASELDRLEAADPASDLSGAIRQLTQIGEPGRLRGLFVVTDGVSSSPAGPAVWARSSEVPIFTAGIGRESLDVRDLAVTAAGGPEIVFRESLVTLTARVRRAGSRPPEALPVTLSVGGRPIQQRVGDLATGEAEVRFTFKPEGAGLAVYRVSVPEAPGGELTTQNNHRDVALWVEEKPRSLLLVAGHPGPEVAFIKRAIVSDPRFALTVNVLQKKADLLRLDRGLLARHEAVVVAGYSRDDFEAGSEALLSAYVRRGEGSLVVLGVAPDEADALFSGELGAVLPGASTRGRPPEGQRLPLVLTPLGARHPITTVIGHPQANQLAFRNLPPVAPSVGLDSKAVEASGGQVLATYPSHPGDLVALALRPAGRTSAVFFNTYESHLLKLLPAASEDRDQVYTRLMINLADWCTDPQSAAGLSMTLPRLRYGQGETVLVAINDYQGILEGREATLTVTRAGDRPQVIRLARPAAGTDTSFVAEQPGVHTLTLQAGPGTEVSRQVFVEQGQWEFLDPLARHDALRDVGRLSGGAFFGEGDRGIEGVGLDSSPLIKEVPLTIQWLDEWPVLLAVLLLLCAEWSLRRARNLV